MVARHHRFPTSEAMLRQSLERLLIKKTLDNLLCVMTLLCPVCVYQHSLRVSLEQVAGWRECLLSMEHDAFAACRSKNPKRNEEYEQHTPRQPVPPSQIVATPSFCFSISNRYFS